ncbi:rhamnogalacturonan acetylesterase [Caldimonas tepidiphila]|uniref:rhamnogalacturonan acetylesterase n=1 Tax=Caldimonas tepidiphila TaxID=2315841 RepID=UPI000E5B4FD9|nr:rhamnogalacturonan acetylesterase [Caldimonas tepidiphila]
MRSAHKSALTACACAVLGSLLSACGGGTDDRAAEAARTHIAGVAAGSAPLAGAEIRVCDAAGASVSGRTAADGSFELDVSRLQAPLLVFARTAPFAEVNGVPQPMGDTQVYAALLPALGAGARNVANVNPLTDKIASDVAATDLKLKGSVQLVNRCNTAGVTAQTVAGRTAELRALVLDALQSQGVAQAAQFDPVTTPMKADRQGVGAVLAMVVHGREGFGNSSSSELGATQLFDRNMQEISAANVKLDPALPSWSAAARRIFVVGDSTASSYGLDVAPRMGWGQVLERRLKDGSGAKVVNLAQSGRSSRSFINEGWMRVLEEHLKPGDYVLVQFGHNDEKCNQGSGLDVPNRCTYPNDASGRKPSGFTLAKLPPGTTEDQMSFQGSLERYVALARAKGATPVLITPVTRIVQDRSVTSHVEGRFPIASSTHVTEAKAGETWAATGNYSQTVLDTAAANEVAAVDLDAKSIAFFNSIGTGSGGTPGQAGWRDYYLAVADTARYPFYGKLTATGGPVSGHFLNGDRTHFQERGAEAVAELIVAEIKAQPARLAGLIALLK